MEPQGWRRVALVSSIVVCGVLGFAAAVYVLVLIVSWLVALLNMPG